MDASPSRGSTHATHQIKQTPNNQGPPSGATLQFGPQQIEGLLLLGCTALGAGHGQASGNRASCLQHQEVDHLRRCGREGFLHRSLKSLPFQGSHTSPQIFLTLNGNGCNTRVLGCLNRWGKNHGPDEKQSGQQEALESARAQQPDTDSPRA